MATTGRVRNVHHVNFVVRDLESACRTWERVLGMPVTRRDELPQWGAITAGFRLGTTWLVLVQPTRPDGEPGRYLAEHGEGFFLLSLGVDSLEQAFEALGTELAGGPVRGGLDGWRVRDIDPQATCGARLQYCEDPGPASDER